MDASNIMPDSELNLPPSNVIKASLWLRPRKRLDKVVFISNETGFTDIAFFINLMRYFCLCSFVIKAIQHGDHVQDNDWIQCENDGLRSSFADNSAL